MLLRSLASTVSAKLFGAAQLDSQSRLELVDHAQIVARRLASHRLIQDRLGFVVEVNLSEVRNVTCPVARIGPFASEAVAIEAARNFAPPVWEREDGVTSCRLCNHSFAVFRRKHHCRNCGMCVCDKCCTQWPAASLPETYLATDARSVSRAATNFTIGLTSDGRHPVVPKELAANWKDATLVRVCAACDSVSARFYRALLDGLDASLARANYESGAWHNVNFWRPLPQGFGVGGLLPIHLAVASGSLPLLQWLVLDRHCPLDPSPFACSAGDPQKSVIRFGIEHAALDILQWLLCADPMPEYRLPLTMPIDTCVNTAVLHRALDAALKDGHRLHNLLDQVLHDAGHQVQPIQHHSTTTAFHVPSENTNVLSGNGQDGAPEAREATAPPFYFEGIEDDAEPNLPEPVAHQPAESDAMTSNSTSHSSDEVECVVCFANVSRRELCALVPCGHACVCNQCGGALSTCPMCRSRVERVMRIFVE